MSEFTTTPKLGLYKPKYNQDAEHWGDHLNANADTLDLTISGLSTDIGGPFLPLAGGDMGGPLNYYASGGATASRSAQDRAAEHYSAADFGVICDGVTDQGGALNAALTAIPIGSTLYIPGSVYTTQTIVVDNGRKLVMGSNALVRPAVGSLLLECTTAIIGSANLSPVVLCTGNEVMLTGVNITRNGTPAAGSIGLQVLTQDGTFTRIYSYNHARCIQVGALRAAPVNGRWSAITTRFDHCIVWRGYEDFVYLINAPETTFYDQRFGITGETDPSGANSLVCFDGDNNVNNDAGTTNTVSFVRGQFNTGGDPIYSLRFYNYGSPDGWITLIGCYSGGAKQAFVYVDPNCAVVRHLCLVNNLIGPLHPAEVLISDPAKRLTSLTVMANHVGGGVAQPAAGLYLSGISAQIIGNTFNGAFTMQLDGMTGGVCTGNYLNTLSITGAFAGTPFTVANNSYTNIVQTATGFVNYIEPTSTYGSQLTVGNAGQGGRIDFKRGTDGALISWVGMASAGSSNPFIVHHGGGSAILALDAADPGGTVSSRVNGVEKLSVGSSGPVLPAGSVFDVHAGAVTGPLALSGVAGSPGRSVVYQTAGSNRWFLGMTTSAESGGNAGANFALQRYDDTGNAIDIPMSAVRSTGAIGFTNLVIGNPASGPTIRSGTGAATGTQPKGSLWMRTDGAAGSTLYVSQGAGTWLPVAGV